MLIGMDCENSTGAHLDDAVGENGSVLRSCVTYTVVRLSAREAV